MNYVKVESSQIAAVAYEPETQTLGLQFPPTKKQVAAGEPGSEYHYSNVPPRLYQALMAAPSIGSYFGQNIKSKPDLYPFTKVEAEPIITVEDAVGPDTPSPGTALAVIDTMADELLFTPGAVTDAQLEAGRQWYLAEAKKYDISTEAERTELKRFARPLQKMRTGIEARAKEITGATKRKIAAIDAEKRRLVQIVGGIEDEVLAPLTTWEREEEDRKTRLAGRVTFIGNIGQPHLYTSSADIETAIAALENIDISDMQEFKVSAESAVAASLKVLKPELERRKVAEAEQAELATLRAAAAARAEQDRIASIASQAREEAERKAAADVAAAQARAELAERMRLAEEQAAVRRAEEATAKAVRDQEAAVEAERQRAAAELARIEREKAVREADKNHRLDVEDEIAKALCAQVPTISPADIEDVISAIRDGKIPHVTINY